MNERSDWLTPHFKRSEFACKCGCGFAAVDKELLEVLEAVRKILNDRYDGTVYTEITSGNRCPKHNKEVGGAEMSQHQNGIAADFKVWRRTGGARVLVSSNEVTNLLDKLFPGKYGIGKYSNRTHLDVRPYPARWTA